jgi:FlaA1/EpsC-like NDP-sugar epimerase
MSPNFRRLILQRAARSFDLVLVTITFLAAFAVSSHAFTYPSFENILVVRIKIVNILVFGGYIAVCSIIFSSCGFYLSHRLSHWNRQVREIFVATTVLTGVLFVLPFKIDFATNEFLLLFWLLTFLGLVASRMVLQRLLRYARSHGRNLRNIVVVGESAEVAALAERIEKEPTLGYRVLCVINAKEL